MEPELRLTLRLQLSPQLIELLKLLQLPRLELEQLIRTELEQNPLLEEIESDEDETESSEEESEPADEFEWAEYLQDDLDPSYKPDRRRTEDFTQQIPAVPASLRDYLMTQVHLRGNSDEQILIGEYIVDSLDDDGYLRSVTVEEIAEALDVELESVESALALVQSLDPPGVGARNLKECLLIQLRGRGKKDGIEVKIVNEHLNDLKNKRYQAITRSLKITEKTLQKAVDVISSLQPRPGSGAWGSEVRYVTPDVLIERAEDEYRVFLNETNIPHLRVSKSYKDVLANLRGRSKKEKEFVRKRLASARFLINGLDERRRTIMKVMSFIAENQRNFLEKGVSQLKPMTLRVVADALGIHESTVSRVIRGKYVQTPQGVFNLKFFFSAAIRSDHSEDVSARSIRARIAELIRNEDKKKTLSDKKIAEILSREGFEVARRTVGKYREEMRILPSKMRREP
ncbi:MAG: RNA polymerase factor sigma-54 [bacterium]